MYGSVYVLRELRCNLLHIYGLLYIIIVPGSIIYTHNTNGLLLRELSILLCNRACCAVLGSTAFPGVDHPEKRGILSISPLQPRISRRPGVILRTRQVSP
jgi:hypothetical protein